MSTTKTMSDLELKVERLVREHLAAYERTARAAVAQAVQSGSSDRHKVARRPSRAAARRRSPSEIATLAQRLYDAICAQPGETMATLSGVVGEPSRALARPVARLLESGRVRTVGQRQFTRYFPMGSVVDAD